MAATYPSPLALVHHTAMCLSRDQSGDTFTLRLARAVKSDAVEEIDKARIAANRIKERKHLQRLQNIGLSFVGLLKPDK